MAKSDVETVDIPSDVAPQGFASKSDEEGVMTKLFHMSVLPEDMSIYYIYPE